MAERTDRPASGAGEEASAPLDDLFAVLCDPERRYVVSRLHEVADGGGTLTCEELLVPWAESAAVETRLHHVHLPKLASTGIVEWYPSTGEVSPGPMWHRVAPALDVLLRNRERLPGSWY